ncbi:flagellin [Vibrio mimicus]
MVMSTVEVRPHNIRLTKHGQTSVMPTGSADLSSKISPRPILTQADPTLAYSVSGMLLMQSEQHTTSVQIASQSLHLIGKELTEIKRGLTQAMVQGSQNVPSLQENVVRSKQKIHQVLNQARIYDKKVLDNELNFKLDRADMRRFSIQGLNAHRLSEKAEQIRLDFPQAQSVMVQFDGTSDGAHTVKMLDRSLIAMGMRASLAEDGTIVFEVQESAYQQMQQKVYVTGEGNRFPAGQPNALKLKAEPEGIAELRFDLGSRDGIRQSIAKVNQHLRRVQTSLEKVRAFYGELSAQMQPGQNQSHVLSTDEVAAKLKGITSASYQFHSTFQALNAQANVRRHMVVALLK